MRERLAERSHQTGREAHAERLIGLVIERDPLQEHRACSTEWRCKHRRLVAGKRVPLRRDSVALSSVISARRFALLRSRDVLPHAQSETHAHGWDVCAPKL